jgi:phage terminase large subunit
MFTKKARYRVWYGGRGSGKSWSVAKGLLLKGCSEPLRILCTREFQISISDSVWRLLCDQIAALGLSNFYEITRNEIKGKNGTLFIFRGLHHNASEIKSMEGVDIAWVEEGENTSDDSLDLLIPTIRKPNSEIIITFNPYRKNDPVMTRFVNNQPPNSIVEKVNYYDNPWFPEVLRAEMEHDKKTNYDRYMWRWEGHPRGISDAQVYKGKYVVDAFDTPEDAEFYHGADWGFAQDPTAIIRCYIKERTLYIDHEAGGVGIDIDDLPTLFDSIPTFRRWRSYADSARPETISYMQKHGFPMMRPVPKWPGSIEDGIEYIKGFERIVVHPRCKRTLEELELYQYKQDRITNEVLPVIIDKNNHYMDALRYAIVDVMKAKKIVVM